MLRMNKKQAEQLLQLTLDGDVEQISAKTGRRRNIEAQLQAVLFVHKKLLERKYYMLRFVFSTLNGMFIPPHLLAKAVEAGLQKGVLDIWAPIRRVDEDGTVWSGLVIDLKTAKGKPTPDQLEWAKHLAANGYRVYFCPGAVDAWWTICSFLGITGPDHWAQQLQAQEDLIYISGK